MGGIGSGSWDRSGTKGLADVCDRIDVLDRYRAGRLAPGDVCERLGGVPLLGFTEDGRVNRSDLYLVLIEWTPCRYGGRRPWFRCPGVSCGERVRLLYRPRRSRYFACRRCYDLAYASQRADAFGRARERGMKIRRRLGSYQIMDPFPEKPKYLHWQTYFRFWEQADTAESEALAHMSAGISALQASITRRTTGRGDRPQPSHISRASKRVGGPPQPIATRP